MKNTVKNLLTFQFFFRFLSFLLITCTCFLLYIFYLLFFPSNSLEIQKVYPLAKQTYVAGELIEVKMDYCKKDDGFITSNIEFVDHVIIPSFSINRYIKAGCGKQTYSIVTPTVAETGVYHIEVDMKYPVNQMREGERQIQTETFKITVNQDLLTRVKKLEDKLDIAGSSATPITDRVTRIETVVYQQPTPIMITPREETETITIQQASPASTPTNIPMATPTSQPTPTPFLPIVGMPIQFIQKVITLIL